MENNGKYTRKFVGRDKDLSNLNKLFDESILNNGQFAMISGEAGIGKTRLVNELKKHAESKGALCLEGNCIYHDVSDPYLPFIEALSKIKGPQLIDDTQKYVMVNEAFLINEAGKVISYTSRMGANIMDEDIVGGMLSAVESFVKDAFGEPETQSRGLNTLVYGSIRVYIEHGKKVFLAVVLSGEEPEGIREDLKRMVSAIEKKYHNMIADWDGDVAKVSEINEIIQKLTIVRYRIKKDIKDIDIKNERDRVFEKALKLIVDASQKDPIMLVLEDIHWADVSSLQLLQYIARNTRDSRVFICATYRPEELDDIGEKKVHPLKEALLRMSRHKMYTPIELTSLNESEVGQILTFLLGTSDFPLEFENRVYRETEGNPFYVEEMFYTFFEEGIISLEGGAWHFHDVLKSTIPSSIKDLVTLRIERLDNKAIDTIKYASVIGKEFDFNVLGETMLLNEEELILTLENLETKNLISPDSENDEVYRFNHSKIREVVYDGIGGHRKRMMHEKAAVSIMGLNKDKEEDVVYQLAHHYSKTKDHGNSLKYSILAGEKASREFAMDEAYDYFSLAQGILDHMDDTATKKEKKLEILVRLSEISYVIGEWDSALRYLNQLIELSDDIGDKTTMFGGYYVLGDIYLSRSEWNLAMDNLKKAFKNWKGHTRLP
jgi:predicted ATPase